MTETVRLTAFLVANQLDIKGIKAFLDIKPVTDSSSELFYKLKDGKFQQYFNYGVIVFAGYTEEEMRWGIKTIAGYQRNPLAVPLRDELLVRSEEGREPVFDFQEVTTGRMDDQVARITMFNLAQSVALDYYHGVSEGLLSEVRKFTQQLETSGKLKISRKNMLRFVGKALNTQNDIAENIYIFDAPDQVWDDEMLDRLHQGLIKHFDLRTRFSEIEYTLRIIHDNLVVFRELIHQRESNLLEFIIILLILVEVFDLFITRVLG